jgi:hypothetical protein
MIKKYIIIVNKFTKKIITKKDKKNFIWVYLNYETAQY